MNASQFMDKQIMELSGSGAQGGGGDLLELLGENQQSNGAGGKKEEVLPSYDFQPIRTMGSSPPAAAAGIDGGRAWGSADSSKAGGSGFRARNYGSMEAHDSSKVIHEKNKEAYDASTLMEFDRTVKKYADNLLHALEGVSSRLSQLEGRTHNLESAVDDLKLSLANNNGSTDGKLRQLENILREVQTGVQVLRDKQEIADTHMQLAKLQASKGDQPPDKSSVAPFEPKQPPVPPPQQPLQQPAQPLLAPTPQLPPPLTTQLAALPMPPAPNAPPPPPPPQQNPPPAPNVSYASHVPQTQVPSIPSMPPREPYFPPPGQPLAEVPQQQYQPPTQQPQLSPPQQYQPAPQLQQYSQLPPSSQPMPPSRPQAPLPHYPEESSPYMPPPQSFPPSIHQPPQLSTGPLPSQQFHGSSTSMYEPPKIRPSSGQQSFSAGYGPPSGPSFSDPYPYSGSPSHYSSGMKPSPFSSSTPRLPTAQILPQALPTASGSGGSGSSGGNRVAIDDVVDKVATMGFPRDLVRATVKRLTDNGQNVDLNVVLDKLMNDTEHQPPKGWFGR